MPREIICAEMIWMPAGRMQSDFETRLPGRGECHISQIKSVHSQSAILDLPFKQTSSPAEQPILTTELRASQRKTLCILELILPSAAVSEAAPLDIKPNIDQLNIKIKSADGNESMGGP